MLHATSASRMYASNVPEQVIKEVTGHHSECVRVYKKTSDKLLKQASSTISGEYEGNLNIGEKRKSAKDMDNLETEAHEGECKCIKESLSV